MTDQQNQNWQPTPPTQQTSQQGQWWGVFGGNPEETTKNNDMFQPIHENKNSHEEHIVEKSSDTPDFTLNHEDIVEEKTEDNNENTTLEWFTLPWDSQEKSDEEKVSEETTPNETISSESSEIKKTPNESVDQPSTETTPPETTETKEITETPNNETEVPEKKETDNEPTAEVSEIQNKVTTLITNIEQLQTLLHLKNEDIVEAIWSKTDTTTILYQFLLNDQHHLTVKRIETEKETDESSFSELKFVLEDESHMIQIFLDDVLLFEEEDLLQDNKKKSQVMEKINKFIFLTESKLKDTEKEMKAKQEEEEERKRLHDIFRNF